jgi:hypothetical protein
MRDIPDDIALAKKRTLLLERVKKWHIEAAHKTCLPCSTPSLSSALSVRAAILSRLTI